MITFLLGFLSGVIFSAFFIRYLAKKYKGDELEYIPS